MPRRRGSGFREAVTNVRFSQTLQVAIGRDGAKSGCEQTQQRSPYSITSSARASSVAGTSRPSALPVLRLMTVSYLVVCLYWQVRQVLAFTYAVNVTGRMVGTA
jgi:hypothetical protein